MGDMDDDFDNDMDLADDDMTDGLGDDLGDLGDDAAMDADAGDRPCAHQTTRIHHPGRKESFRRQKPRHSNLPTARIRRAARKFRS